MTSTRRPLMTSLCVLAISIACFTAAHAAPLQGNAPLLFPAPGQLTTIYQDDDAGTAEPLILDPPAVVAHDLSADPNETFVHFPEEHAPFSIELIESLPTVLTKPAEPLARSFGWLIGGEHDQPHTELDDYAIGIQPVPERPPLLIEWNEGFLAPGFLEQGVEIPTGAVWRPSLWVFGEYRTAIQYTDMNRAIDPVAEWTHRLDLFAQVNLTGTERVLMQFRPFDEEEGAARSFSGYDFHNGDGYDGSNFRFNTLFFEGDFGELFPGLDPYDFLFLDYGFAVGRMPLLAQQGLLINEDMIDAVTVTRNTLSGGGNLNLRMTGVYAWSGINRNSPIMDGNLYDGNSRMVGLLTESDFAESTVNADVVYVYGNAAGTGDLAAFGVSSIRRNHLFENTYNSSLHFLASYPTNGTTPYADQGQLLFAQTSWTPHHSEDLIYLNGFWAIDQFTSPARGTLAGGALGQTGILYSATGVGRVGAPLGVRTNDRVGASLGYQFFYDHTRQQVIMEIGGHKETKGANSGALGLAVRWQRAIGQHWIFLMDGYVAKREGMNTAPGARAEFRIKY